MKKTRTYRNTDDFQPTTRKRFKCRSNSKKAFTECQNAPFYPLSIQQGLSLLEDLYQYQHYTPNLLRQIASNMGFINLRNQTHCFALELTFYKALMAGLPTYLKTHSEDFLTDLYPNVELTGEDWRFFLSHWLENSKHGGVSSFIIPN